MRKHILILFFLFIILPETFASGFKLFRYNTLRGNKFVYEICDSIWNKNRFSSLTYTTITITPISFSRNNNFYELTVNRVLKYTSEKRKLIESFDTNYPNENIDKFPEFCRDLENLKLVFSTTLNGKIMSIKFKKYLNQLNKYPTNIPHIENLKNKNYWIELIMKIFTTYAKGDINKGKKWAIKSKTFMNKINLNTKFDTIKYKETKNGKNYFSGRSSHKVISSNSSIVGSSIYNKYTTIVSDEKTNMILSKRITQSYSVYDKKILQSRVNTNIRCLVCNNKDLNNIKITYKTNKKTESIDFETFSYFAKKEVVKLGKNNTVFIERTIDEPRFFRIDGINIFLKPGENIFIERRGQHYKLRGVTGNTNKLLNQYMESYLKYISPDIINSRNQKKHSELTKKAYSYNKKLLLSYKNRIDNELYTHLENISEAYYVSSYLSPYISNPKAANLTVTKPKFNIDNICRTNHYSIVDFLAVLLEYEYSQTRKYKQFSRYYDEFSITNLFFKSKARYLLTAYYLDHALYSNWGDFEKTTQIFNQFLEDCNDEKLSKYIDSKYREVERIQIGQTIKKYNLVSLNKKKITTHDFNNITVLKHISSLPKAQRQSSIRLYKIHPDVFFINFYSDPKLSGTFQNISNVIEIDASKEINSELHRILKKIKILVINKDKTIVSNKAMVDEQKAIERAKTEKSSINIKLIISILLSLAVAVIVVFYIVKWRTNLVREREERKRKMAELKLKAIRSQMNPHFMFNSLASIQNHVLQNNSNTAYKYLNIFARLMRMILEYSEEQIISLAEELECIELYLNLESMRHKFSFNVRTGPKIDLNSVEIPCLLLQPYVENAVIHGISGMNEKGSIDISLRHDREDKNVICIIEDNGKGLKAKKSSRKSFGLILNRERLNIMKAVYNKEINVDIFNKADFSDDTGVIIKITIPL